MIRLRLQTFKLRWLGLSVTRQQILIWRMP
jgi:hypothetical protein